MQAEQHRDQCAAAATARSHVVAGGSVTSEPLRAAQLHYYRLLGALEMRFSASTELQVQFVWRDAFQKVVRMGEGDLRYESAAVLFNLAAGTSFAAIHTPRQDTERLKLACNLFQSTAGILELLLDHISSAAWANRSTVDLSPTALRTMRTLMLAQAQRCYYERAVLDGLSPKLLSRIAAQLSLYYEQICTALRVSPLQGHMPSSWLTVCGWNRQMFEGMAHLHLAAIHAEEYEYGKQVCRLQAARALLKPPFEQSAKSELHITYKQAHEKVAAAAALAERDNNTVYNETVPALSSLPPLAPHAIVKPTPPPALLAPLAAEEDPFVHVVPQSVKAQLAGYDNWARGILSECSGLLGSVITAGDTTLANLDLPWSLQAVEQGDAADHGGLPSKVVDAIEHARSCGGTPALEQSVGSLAILVKMCASTAERVNTVLEQEREHEVRMRTEHGQKWSLLMSGAEDAERIKTELAQLEDRLPALFDAHEQIGRSHADAADALSRLDFPIEVHAENVPHAGGSPVARLPVTAELRQTLDELEMLRFTRDELLTKIVALEGSTFVARVNKDANGAGVSMQATPAGCVGVRVLQVRQGGPCALGGLRVGDTILRVNGVVLSSHTQAIALIKNAHGPLEIAVHRASHDQSLINALVYRGESSEGEVLTARLKRYAPLQEKVAVFAVEHAKCVERVQLANEAFMQARIQETELLARQDYFRQLSELAASYADLSCRTSDAVADLSEASVQLDALHEQANHLAALRLVQREELASRLEEETADAARPPRSPSAPQLDATVSVGSSEDPFPTPGEAAHGASAPPPGADVTKLMEMGFSRDQAAGALETSANDLAGAISLLLLGDSSVRSSPPDSPSAADPTPPPPLPSRGLSFKMPSALPPKVARLVDMGFTREQAASALQRNDGDLAAAAAELLANPPSAAPAEPPPPPPPVSAPLPASPGSHAADVAELVGMGFDAALAISVLDRCNGVLHEAVQMLLDAPEGAPLPPPAAPAGPPQPQPAAAMPTAQGSLVPNPFLEAFNPTDREAQQLIDMGFAPHVVDIALMHTGRDVAQALNLLFDPKFEGHRQPAPSQPAPPPPAPPPTLVTPVTPVPAVTAFPAVAAPVAMEVPSVPMALPPWAAPGAYPAAVPWAAPPAPQAANPPPAAAPARSVPYRPMQYEMD